MNSSHLRPMSPAPARERLENGRHGNTPSPDAMDWVETASRDTELTAEQQTATQRLRHTAIEGGTFGAEPPLPVAQGNRVARQIAEIEQMSIDPVIPPAVDRPRPGRGDRVAGLVRGYESRIRDADGRG